MSKRSIGILILLGIIGFYAFGTGFSFFYKFFYSLILVLSLCLGWAWLGLRGIDIQLLRTANRGQVGGYMEGRVRFRNRNRLPKSWLEVVEATDLPDPTSGRGLAMVRDQVRAWRTETYLRRRGVFTTGQMDVTSQDPFGMFQLRRRFLSPQTFTVLPAVHPLPDLDPFRANLPSDGRVSHHWDHITTDVSSVRHYTEGDSYRRIHWPYTARMNTLMVKEFDIGVSAESWIVLDMEAGAHVGVDLDPVENSEEVAVSVAASLVNRLAEFGLPVGLALSGSSNAVHRPNTSPEYPGRLMEALAVVRASGDTTLERFLYDLRPIFSRFNTLTVITPSVRLDWVQALVELRRRGVSVRVVIVDPQGYGSEFSIDPILQSLAANELGFYVVRRGQDLNEALGSSILGGRTRSAGQMQTAPRKVTA